jgi:Cu-processing system ATP-binding protein
MIRLEQLCKSYGQVAALHPVDLEIQAGEWLGLVGHNGSGKTTLLHLLLGLTRPSSGRLWLDGAEPQGEADWIAFRRRLGFMPERISFYEHLSGEEVLGFLARLRGADPRRIPALLEQVGLAGAAQRQVGGYSKGMQQRLNLAQALLGDPELLVLDEPTEGLDPQGVHEFFQLLAGQEGRTVILSSHRLAELNGRVSRLCLLDQGRLKAVGTLAELRRRLCLPMRVRLRLTAPLNGALNSLLEKTQARVAAREEHGLVLEVPQEQKLFFLAQLGALQEWIAEAWIEESSLEEVYLGLR